ncbi:hypothetical protein [Haliscomenobacter hydrossis]|uniref:Uncharacterized protein n=1 Tax=Haliscomenobacter hydrossis (strain ATCC 27775 / DSM 1100 / LMG 10767 / O) TaxID=760192 RepID=F4KPB6_HALH1|nr:hypothetical protein [Haliscomenobacter hydrossis]AEE48910.1 hypothetical protein Halhy_1011 [Haliscomenobacter hydrossis DSM 1100]
MLKNRYVLKFENREQPFDEGSGIPMSELLDLLNALLKATPVDNPEDIIIKDIRHESYGPVLSIKDLKTVGHLQVIHRQLQNGNLSNFNASELSYASKLKVVLKGGKIVLWAFNPDSDEEVDYISDFEMPKLPDFYYVSTSIVGVLTSIGSRSLAERAVLSIHVSGFNHSIKVTQAQEKALIQYFKKQSLRFKITKKIDFLTNEVKEAELESFTPLSDKTFAELAAEIKASNPEGFFNDIESTPDFMRKLRSIEDEIDD